MELNKKAMIVDDSRLTQKQLAQIFTEAGIEVAEVASNGVEAVEKFNARKGDFDIITLDITMPLLDGLSVLKKILETDANARILMVSAIGKENVIKSCMQAGARNFIIKPFHAEKVKEIIRNVIAA
jgi:two-component system, chemotaxis family, chemotaxis protein CheY